MNALYCISINKRDADDDGDVGVDDVRVSRPADRTSSGQVSMDPHQRRQRRRRHRRSRRHWHLPVAASRLTTPSTDVEDHSCTVPTSTAPTSSAEGKPKHRGRFEATGAAWTAHHEQVQEDRGRRPRRRRHSRRQGRQHRTKAAPMHTTPSTDDAPDQSYTTSRLTTHSTDKATDHSYNVSSTAAPNSSVERKPKYRDRCKASAWIAHPGTIALLVSLIFMVILFIILLNVFLATWFKYTLVREPVNRSMNARRTFSRESKSGSIFSRRSSTGEQSTPNDSEARRFLFGKPDSTTPKSPVSSAERKNLSKEGHSSGKKHGSTPARRSISKPNESIYQSSTDFRSASSPNLPMTSPVPEKQGMDEKRASRRFSVKFDDEVSVPSLHSYKYDISVSG